MTQVPLTSGDGLVRNPPSKKKQSPVNVVRVWTTVVAVFVVVIIVVVVVRYIDSMSNQGSSSGHLSVIGMAGGNVTTVACGTTAGALYKESVSIPSLTVTVATNEFGLKVLPTLGGSSVALVEPPASGSACPTSGGFYVALANSAGTVIACESGPLVNGSAVWSSPTSDACANPVGAVLGSPITISIGQTFVVYMYGTGVVPPMAGAYTMQVYGIGGTIVSGSVDL